MKWNVIRLGGAILLLPVLFFSQYLPYQQGWPVYVNGPSVSSIKICDLDNDKKKEIIYGDFSYLGQDDWWLYVKNYNGTDKSGWPKNYAGCQNTPSLADLDDDGTLEIIKPCGGLKVWNYNGRQIWEYDNPSGVNLAYSSVDDLDNDGIKEIVVTCVSGGAVFVFEPDGTLRDGWPVLGQMDSYQSASIGDIDNDGKKEIIITSAKIYCLKENGDQCQGFPIDYPFSSRSKPVLADIDNDGYLEIIFGWEDAKLRIIRYDGTDYPGYPIDRSVRNIALGDVNLDNSYDLCFNWNKAYAYDARTATLFDNFPINQITDSDGTWGYSEKAPNLLDLSDAFGKEIATGAASGAFVYDGKLFAFNLDGQVVDGFPSDFLYHRGLTTGCSVDDLDGDGDVEICCGSENTEWATIRHSNVFCWDSPHPWNRDLADWMMDGFDLQNTGRWRKLYHIDEVQSTIEVIGCAQNPCILPADGNLYEVKIKAKRKFADEYPTGQDVRVSRTLGCGEYEGPVIDNGDGTYIRYLRAPMTECHTTVEGWVNEFKVDSCIELYFGPYFGFCDSNGVRCEITDVQRAVNKNLGKEPCTTCADCEPDGLCSITDIQKIVNCNLGLNINCY